MTCTIVHLKLLSCLRPMNFNRLDITSRKGSICNMLSFSDSANITNNSFVKNSSTSINLCVSITTRSRC